MFEECKEQTEDAASVYTAAVATTAPVGELSVAPAGEAQVAEEQVESAVVEPFTFSQSYLALFPPSGSTNLVQDLLLAIHMGEALLVKQMLEREPGLLFQAKDCAIPLMLDNETQSSEHELAYYNVTPLQLMLYTGDWTMWNEVFSLPTLPITSITQIVEEMRRVERGGPDLVTMDTDPSTVPFARIQQVDIAIPLSDTPATIDLLSNPDGIVYYQHPTDPAENKWFYVNQDTQEVRLLEPNVAQEDQEAFNTLCHTLTNELPKNASCRSSDEQHRLIARVFGCTLERSGIEYGLDGVRYQDTHDGCNQLIRAYRSLADERAQLDPVASISRVGQAQRLSPAHIILWFCRSGRSSDPLPTQEALLSEKFDRHGTFYNNRSEIPGQVFPLKKDHGLGFDYLLYRGTDLNGHNKCTGQATCPMPLRQMAIVNQFASAEKQCRQDWIRTLAQQLGEPNEESQVCVVS